MLPTCLCTCFALYPSALVSGNTSYLTSYPVTLSKGQQETTWEMEGAELSWAAVWCCSSPRGWGARSQMASCSLQWLVRIAQGLHKEVSCQAVVSLCHSCAKLNLQRSWLAQICMDLHGNGNHKQYALVKFQVLDPQHGGRRASPF